MNAVVRDYLISFADTTTTRQAVDAFLELATQAKANSGSGGRTWTCDELHGR